MAAVYVAVREVEEGELEVGVTGLVPVATPAHILLSAHLAPERTAREGSVRLTHPVGQGRTHPRFPARLARTLQASATAVAD